MNSQSQDQERIDTHEQANNIQNTENQDQNSVKYLTNNYIELFKQGGRFELPSFIETEVLNPKTQEVIEILI
jgi:hypothetical protein